ncbi:MAG: hypothetical protein EKK33_29465 [Bradyrhizobiaceae bacterium]|nr:MAG: hypothetical protein EKK33_29465 [Bradyrhizobiaceae bacterium]
MAPAFPPISRGSRHLKQPALAPPPCARFRSSQSWRKCAQA